MKRHGSIWTSHVSGLISSDVVHSYPPGEAFRDTGDGNIMRYRGVDRFDDPDLDVTCFLAIIVGRRTFISPR